MRTARVNSFMGTLAWLAGVAGIAGIAGLSGIAGFIGLAACVTPPQANAATMTWNGGNGNWCNVNGWDPHQIPDAADEIAVLGGNSPYTVSLDGTIGPGQVDLTNPEATLLFLNGTSMMVTSTELSNYGTIDTAPGSSGIWGELVNRPGARILLRSGVLFGMRGSLLRNDGEILVNSDQLPGTANFRLNDPSGITLGGTGQLILQGGDDPTYAELGSYQGTPWTQTSEHTILGEGVITAALVNEGLVSARTNGKVLRISGAAKTNRGVLEARDGAILEITGATLTQELPGLIQADGGTVRIVATTMWGGALTAQNGGLLEVGPGISGISDVSITGPMNILGGARVYAGLDSWINNGTVVLNPDRQPDDAVIQGWPHYNVMFGGTGQIIMRTGGDVNDARMETTGEIIINGPNHTIRGEGLISCLFENRGKIWADEPGRPLRLAGSNKTNNAQMEARSGGILEFEGAWVDQRGGGTLTADNGIVRVLSGTRVEGGVLRTLNGGRIVLPSGTSAITDVTNQGDLDVMDGAVLAAGNSLITNDGTILLNPDRQATAAIIRADWHRYPTFGGGGQIVLRTAGDPNSARLESGGEVISNGPDHRIRGTGAITCPFNNYGTVSADETDGILRISGGAISNDGTLEASDGGRLEIPAPFLNQGVAQSRGGGTARFGNVGLNWGGGTLHGGTWRVYANSTMRLIGAEVRTLAASLLLDGADSRLLLDDATGNALALLSQVTMEGRLEVRNGRTLAPGGALRVDGTVVVGSGGALTVPADYAQYGDSLSGRTSVDGLLTAAQGVHIHGGVLDGVGTVTGTVANSGRIEPGHSAGQLTVNGDFTQDAAGTLVIELAGAGVAEHDQLAVTGAAALGGRLVVRAIGGYLPQNGASFTVVTCAARTLQFDTVVSEVGDGATIQVIYGPTSVTVVVSTTAGIEDPEVPVVELPANPGPVAAGPAAIRLAVRLGSDSPVIALDLPDAADVRVTCFDLRGCRVAQLADRPLVAGTHEWRWAGRGDDGRALASGVYFVRAEIRGPDGTEVRSARIPLVR